MVHAVPRECENFLTTRQTSAPRSPTCSISHRKPTSTTPATDGFSTTPRTSIRTGVTPNTRLDAVENDPGPVPCRRMQTSPTHKRRRLLLESGTVTVAAFSAKTARINSEPATVQRLWYAARGLVGRRGVFTLTGRLGAAAAYCARHNTVFQGLAADGAKLALWQLYRAGYRIVNFVHDEIVVEVAAGPQAQLLAVRAAKS